jgi:hypothetical protein
MIRKIFNSLSRKQKSQLSKLSFIIQLKPKVMRSDYKGKRFPGDFRGGVIISSDFELGWAVRYSKQSKDPHEYAQRERQNIPVILKALEAYQIPVTWSTVGHLFLDKCDRGDHDWMNRIPYFDDHWKYTEGDWFDCDPHTHWENGKDWYAPDLIQMILDCKVPQEFACHTFSHIDCSYKNCPPSVIDDELKACFEAGARWGITFTSMTFPGGTAGNFEILKKYGIGICRQRHKDLVVAYPYFNKQGIIITPTGPVIAKGYPGWTLDYTFSRLKKAIDKAIRTETIAHFWFHPSQESGSFTELLPLVLKYCSRKRQEGLLWVGTMQQIAEHLNKSREQDSFKK